MSIVLPLSVPAYNVLKYVISGLILGIISEEVGQVIERLRRSYSLKSKGKVRIFSYRNRILRTITGNRLSVVFLISLLVTIVIFLAEGSLELGSDSVLVGVPQRGIVQAREMKDYKLIVAKSFEHTDAAVFPIRINTYTCATEKENTVYAWSANIQSTNTIGGVGEKISCPRNVSTSNIYDNEEFAAKTSLHELADHTIRLATKFNWAYKYSVYGNYLFTSSKLNLSSDIDDVWIKYRTDDDVMYYQGIINVNNDMQCLIRRRYFSRTRVENELNGCSVSVNNGTEYLYLQARRRPIDRDVFFSRNEIETRSLQAVSMTKNITLETRHRLMSLIFGLYELDPAATAVLFSSLASKMAEDGDLDPKNSSAIERVMGYESVVRPSISIWALSVFLSLFAFLMVFGFILSAYSSKIFPIKQLSGEMDIAAIALCSKSPDSIGKDYWISLEKQGKEQWLEVMTEEPETSTFDSNIPITKHKKTN